jgi:hypothetical protein
MLFCARHGLRFLPLPQVWITSKLEEVPEGMRSPQTIGTACDVWAAYLSVADNVSMQAIAGTPPHEISCARPSPPV